MATSTQLANPAVSVRRRSSHNPLVLWHLLSLDAPTVAALWTWFLARANHIHLPPSSVVAMFLAVWILYVADRLLDTRVLHHRQDLEERHFFHRLHRRVFAAGIIFASIAVSALLPRLPSQSLCLYLILGAFLLAYFVLIHAAAAARRLPKELAVGVFFSAATFIPTVSRQPGLRLTLLPAAILFAVLCSLNCLFIYDWEHPAHSLSTHRITRIALRFLLALALSASTSGVALALFDRQLPVTIPLSCALSALLLVALHRLRGVLARSTMRAAADLCLLTPILLLPFLLP